MPSVTLDDIQAAADRKYGPFTVDMGDGQTCTLLNALRLSKDKRKKVLKLQDLQDEDAENVEDHLIEMVRLTAQSKADADRLLKAIGNDLALLAEILEQYGKASELGEASASES